MWGWVWKVCSAKSNRDLTWAGSDTSGRNAAARGAEEEEEREMGVELIWAARASALDWEEVEV